jgi:hypothetical protein
MNAMHSLPHLDPGDPRFFNYSTVQSFPGLELPFVLAEPWTDPTVYAKFGPRLIVRRQMFLLNLEDNLNSTRLPSLSTPERLQIHSWITTILIAMPLPST